MKNEQLTNFIESCLDNISEDEFLDMLKNENDKKIGLMLYSLGYKKAISDCTKALDKIK